MTNPNIIIQLDEGSECDYSDDEEYYSSTESDSLKNKIDKPTYKKYILGKHIHKINNSELYIANGKRFAKHINTYSFNNSLNEKHISNLVKSIRIKNHYNGTVAVAELSEEEELEDCFVLLDGHHRISAIQEVIKEDNKFNIDLLLQVYHSDRIDSEKNNAVVS